MIFKENLLELNRRGLIHAPDESDETFFLRCRHAGAIPTAPPSELAKEIFDIEPDWVWMVYADKGLRFWEGACTWTEREHSTLQLKKVFEKKGKFLGYSRDEVIAHELVHMVRNQFEEPIFEEILAYQTSPSLFRRFFAPLFRSPSESLIFMIALSAVCLASWIGLFQQLLLGAFATLTCLWGIRLLWAQWTFARTRQKLSLLVGKSRCLAVMVRMTDREIIRFSKMSLEEIQSYSKKMAKIQMRWQQIAGAYFTEKKSIP